MEGNEIRRIVIEQSKRANVGHIGSALSVADIMACIFNAFPRLGRLDEEDRPRLVMSKGHAALALYAALFLKGHINQAKLDTYCGDNTELGVHPERADFGVDFATGSLGMGLSIATGSALGAKIARQQARQVICLMSDAEMNEGVVWEAAQFAAHHELFNLRVFVDVNMQQAFGKTYHVLRQQNLRKRWAAFGWFARYADGHDPTKINAAMSAVDPKVTRYRPSIILARTTFGKGVSYMESQIKWHYLPMDDHEYNEARVQLGQEIAE